MCESSQQPFLIIFDQSRVSEVEQHCQVQLTLAEAQAAQLRQEKAEEEAAAAKRIDGECGGFLSTWPFPSNIMTK